MSGGKSYRDVVNVEDDLQMGFTDISGTPGSGAIPTPRGRFAFAALGSTVTITSPLITPSSTVLVMLSGATDATLTSILTAVPSSGSVSISGNAAATGTTIADMVVFN